MIETTTMLSIPLPIENTLRHLFGQDIKIEHLPKKLNVRPGIMVWRLFLNGKQSIPKSVIVKYCINDSNVEQKKSVTRRFIEENLCYQFLSQIRPLFDRCPVLLGKGEDFLILEDLGEDTYTYPAENETYDSVATALALLHVASADKYPLFKKMRLEAGLAVDDENIKRSSNATHAIRLFLWGKQTVRETGDALGIFDDTFDKEIEEVWQTIIHPDIFLAFIHDDFTERRQSVSINGQVYLLDFEHAHYSHALLDVCRIMVGKIETTANQNYHFFVSHNFHIAFAQLYRQKIEALRQFTIEEKIWQEALSAALIFSTLQVVGLVMSVAEGGTLAEPVPSYMKLLLTRLLDFLNDNESYPNLKYYFQELVKRIY